MSTRHVMSAAFIAAAVAGVVAGAASAAGRAQTAPTPCSLALATTCDPATEAAFQRWGANLPLLRQADLGPYGDPARYPSATPELAALTACRLVSENADMVDGERDFFLVFMSGLYPTALLDDFTALFDASMQYVCPDLGYERGFAWDSQAGAERPTDTLALVVPGEPSWGFVSCAAALGFEPCATGGFGPSYEQWGSRLPFLYNDPDGDYVGPAIGDTYQSEDVDYTDVNMMALSLCQTMLAGGDDAVADWLEGQAARYPEAGPDEHLRFFYYTMTRVCPEVTLPTG